MINWLAITLAIVGLDFISKRIVLATLAERDPVVLIKGFLRLSYVENKGMAFGLLPDKRWIFMVLSVATIAAMVFIFVKYKPGNRLLCTALVMICAGGVGNMIDRVFYGFVVDMIDFYGIWPFVFNVADSSVCVGAALLVLWLILDMVKDSKKKKAAETAPDAASGDAGNGNSDKENQE